MSADSEIICDQARCTAREQMCPRGMDGSKWHAGLVCRGTESSVSPRCARKNSHEVVPSSVSNRCVPPGGCRCRNGVSPPYEIDPCGRCGVSPRLRSLCALKLVCPRSTHLKWGVSDAEASPVPKRCAPTVCDRLPVHLPTAAQPESAQSLPAASVR